MMQMNIERMINATGSLLIRKKRKKQRRKRRKRKSRWKQTKN